ncbi:HAMP domain-containing histidine kinase [Akkermansiaceae bacterium]|nr:HAMP domain-containing histidine kinase [Akkermansiaceae bacterium]
MNSKRFQKYVQSSIGLLFIAMVIGWSSFMVELYHSDIEVSQAKARVAEERYLEEKIEQFATNRLRGAVIDESFVPRAAKEDLFAGVWRNSFLHRNEQRASGIKAWPDGLQLETSDDLLTHEADLNWGEVTDGRDRLGSLLLTIARKEGAGFEALGILKEGVWFYPSSDPLKEGEVGGSMSPGFRLLLISELEKRESTSDLVRLKNAERIRAVEGDRSMLEEELEVLPAGDGEFFFTKQQLERLFNSEDLELSSSPPEGKSWLRVQGFERWPYLSFIDGANLGSKATGKGKWLDYVTRISTLIATIGLVYYVIKLGRHQMAEAKSQIDLAASVAHELRTPLAGQRVVLESLLNKKEFNEDYLQMALRENQRLGGLAEEFLTFSRLERGIIELQLKPISLAELLDPIVLDYREQHEGISLQFDSENDSSVLADEAAFATIARNLIENADKYSDGSEVRIQLVESEGKCGFSVTDQGVGLSRAEQARIFKQFYRVDKKLSRSQDGLGLGLSIVKRLVDAMDGEIEVQSEKGKGSTFTIWLQKGGQA